MGRKKIDIKFISNKRERAVSTGLWQAVDRAADPSVDLLPVKAPGLGEEGGRAGDSVWSQLVAYLHGS